MAKRDRAAMTAVAVNTEQSQDQAAVMVSLIQRAATDPAFDLEKLDQAAGRQGAMGSKRRRARHT